MAREGGALELGVIDPVGVLGRVPGCPKIYFGLVDVQDVADLHLRAMTHPAANGERLLAVSGEPLSMLEVGRVLRERMGDETRKVSTRQLPSWLVRLAALRDPALKQVLPELGKVRRLDGRRAGDVLGWEPRPPEEVIVATAESLIRLGILRDGEKS